MKRFAAFFFCVFGLHLVADAQSAKPGAAATGRPAAPAAAAAPGASKPAAQLAATADGRPAGEPRPTPVSVRRYAAPRLSAEPAQFILDVGTMLTATNSAPAKAVGEQLRQLWGTNQLTTSQQRVIAGLGQRLLDKQLKPVPHLTTFFTLLVGAKSGPGTPLSDAQTDQLLETLSQSVAHDPAADVAAFLSSTARVLSTGYLYRSGFSGLRLLGREQLSFAYRPGPAAPDPNATFDGPASPAAPAAPANAASSVPASNKSKTAASPRADGRPVKLLTEEARAILENKPAPKSAPKPAPQKKRASDGWDTADPWATVPKVAKSTKVAANDGWGSAADDGWGPPIRRAAPKAKSKIVAKAGAKAPAKTAPSTNNQQPITNNQPTSADFDQANVPFVPSAAAAYDAYVPPVVTGPVLELKDAELLMGTQGDSLVLRKLSGVVGARGRVLATGAHLDWTIQGQPASAELGPFDFEVSKAEFTSQPATLTYAARLEAPAKGALSYKSVRRKAGQTESTYPRFISLTNDVRLRALGAGLSFQGGLSLAGPNLASAALDGSLGTLTRRGADGQRQFRAVSNNFVLADSVLRTSMRAAVTIYQGTADSLTHPGVELRYLKRQEQLRLLYARGTYQVTPWSDSFHQVDIGAQLIVWNLAEPHLEMSIVTTPTQVAAGFESKGFFSTQRYAQLKTINHLHPLQVLVNYSNTHGKPPAISLRNVAEELHLSEANLRSAASGLARDGYVDVRPQTGEVVLLPKGKHYVGAAREKKDYDYIAIKSLTGSGRSATLNFASKQLVVRGVKQFSFSADTAAAPVLVRPDSGIVRLERNRNLRFSGRVTATIYGFKGRDFQFDYDGYYIDMPRIDSLTIRSKARKKAVVKTSASGSGVASTAVPTDAAPSEFLLTNKGKFQSGRLFLNDPRNRSGRRKLPSYPKFNSTSGAYVYFNKPDVLGGAYDSTTYFDVPPFSFDSMGTGRSRGSFVGLFHSRALPPIRTALSTQPDGSLGFVHTVPAGGYELYGGKGRLAAGARVQLNNQGLQTNGTVTYQQATLTSDRFVLYADSLTGEGKTGSIAASDHGPPITLPPGYLIRWRARADSLQLRTPPGGAAAKLYANHSFKGALVVTSTSVGGSGRLDGPQSYVRSKQLVFGPTSYSGKNALLSVKSSQAGKAALTAPDVSFTYDLKRGTADFRREEGSTANIELPYSGFRSSLNGGRWDFKKKRVLLRAAGADSARASFVSTLPELQGLRFRAATASYDLTKYQLQAKGVPYVAAADAWIVPDSGRVAVSGGGRLQPFKRATVLLDSLGRFHKLVKGTITVVSRKEFTGEARYMSRTASGDSVALRFVNFQPDSAAGPVVASGKRRFGFGRRRAPQAAPPAAADSAAAPNRAATNGAAADAAGVATVATATVEDAQKFQLVPRVGFRGGIVLNSRRRGLIFDGEAQLQFGKRRDPNTAAWFAVKDSLDPQHLDLDLKQAKDAEGQGLVTGLYVSDTDNKIFPLYAGPKPAATDIPLLDVSTGHLRYDNRRRTFTIAEHDPEAADAANQYAGAQLVYQDSTNRVSFRGPLNFISPGPDKGRAKGFRLAAAGVGAGNPDSARYRVRALLGVGAGLPPKAQALLAALLAKTTKNSPEALDGSQEDLYNVAQLGGNKAALALAERRPGLPAPALPGLLGKQAAFSLLLSRADLRWNARQAAWHSVGPLGVAGAGTTGLNALVSGYVEIKHENAADEVSIYLEPEPQTWAYLHFAGNVLTVISSSEQFNAEIASKQKGSPEVAQEYGVFGGDYDEVDRFRAHFLKDYLGQSGKLAARPTPPPPPDEVETGKGRKKKKKAKADDPFGDGVMPDPNAPATEPAAEPTSKKKKKKAKDNDPFADGVMPDPNAPAPTEEPAPKKGRKAKAAAPAADPTAAPAEEPGSKKKKKKAKDNDPFGDGVMPDPNAAPAEPAPDPAPKKKRKAKTEDPAAAPGDNGSGVPVPAASPPAQPEAPKKPRGLPKPDPAAAAAAAADLAADEAAAAAAAQKKKKKNKVADPAPTAAPVPDPAAPAAPADPAAAPEPTLTRKQRKALEKEKAAEAAPDPAADPAAEPAVEPDKKSKKKKKAAEQDPFGGN